jgi:hypothetical protein
MAGRSTEELACISFDAFDGLPLVRREPGSWELKRLAGFCVPDSTGGVASPPVDERVMREGRLAAPVGAAVDVAGLATEALVDLLSRTIFDEVHNIGGEKERGGKSPTKGIVAGEDVCRLRSEGL